VPMHDLNLCPAKSYVARVRGVGEKGKNPFAVLGKIKKTR
jgi:hypothetical protein